MYGLVDTDSGIILARVENITIANFLMEIPPDTFLVPAIHLVPGYELLKNGEPHYNFYFNRYPDRIIGRVTPERTSLRPNAKEISDLYRMKQVAVFKFMDILRYHRLKHSTTFEYQGVIYEEKARQAKDLLSTNIVNESKHFYVTSFARVKNMSEHDAARLIVLKHTMFHEELSLNESLRIKYFDIVRKATTSDEINLAFRQFHKETLFNQHAEADVV